MDTFCLQKIGYKKQVKGLKYKLTVKEMNDAVTITNKSSTSIHTKRTVNFWIFSAATSSLKSKNSFFKFNFSEIMWNLNTNIKFQYSSIFFNSSQ